MQSYESRTKNSDHTSNLATQNTRNSGFDSSIYDRHIKDIDSIKINLPEVIKNNRLNRLESMQKNNSNDDEQIDLYINDSVLIPYYMMNCNKAKKLKITGDVKTIEDNAFIDCEDLQELDLSQTRITYIGANTFLDCENLKKLSLPPSLKFIEESAFYDFKNLQEIDLSNTNMTDIKSNTFTGCEKLENVLLPKKLQYIETSVFEECENIDKMLLPPSLKYIGEYAFYYCTNLKLDLFNTDITDIDDGAFYYCDSLNNIVFPKSLENIGSNLFSGCENLEKVDLSNTKLKYIESNMFANCTNLNKIILSTNLESISDNSFAGCENLQELDLSNTKLKNIRFNCFMFCKALSKLLFPPSLETIGASIFMDCTSLKELDLSNTNIKSIPPDTFSNCESLDKVLFPQKLESIGPSAFSNCISLKDLQPYNSNLKSIGSSAFWGCIKLKELELSKIKSIGAFAFKGCESLDKIGLPSNMDFIGYNAFKDCNFLRIENINKELVEKLGGKEEFKRKFFEFDSFKLLRPDVLAGVPRGDEMSFKDAGDGKVNPNYCEDNEYGDNCQSCVVAYEARRRGYDVEALSYSSEQAHQLSECKGIIWIDPATGQHPGLDNIDVEDENELLEYMQKNTKENERYVLSFSWQDLDYGHIVNIYKEGSQVNLYDPQDDEHIYDDNELLRYFSEIDYGFNKSLLRIDNLIIDEEIAKHIMKPH